MVTKAPLIVRLNRLLLAPAVIVAPCLALASRLSVAAAPPPGLRAGAAKTDITPKTLNGLVSVWAKPFEGVHDHIYARALVVGSGPDMAAVVATDLVEIGDTTDLRRTIEHEAGIPVDHIIITASHDHNAPRSGPITPGTSSASGRPASSAEYTKLVDDQILAAVRQAKAAMQPARIGVGTGSADLNVNRNAYGGQRWGGPNPDGPSDKTVWVVKLENLSGEPIALLMNYAIHSVVAGPDNALITGDLAGATERFVERHYKDKVVALWTMGPAGDQNPKYNMSVPEQGQDADPAVNKTLAYEAMDAEGVVLGAEVLQTAARIKQTSATAAIRASERIFSCASQPPKPRPAGPPAAGGFAPNPNFGPPPPPPATMPVRLSLVMIDRIAITGVSGEIFTRIYWRLKKASPLSDTILVTMANDRIGYIGDDAEYFGPFTNPSLAKGCAEDGIVNGLVDMITGDGSGQ